MTINLTIPEQWNDLNARQLKKIAGYFHSGISGVLMDCLVFVALLDVRWWELWKKYKALKTINHVGLSELKKHYSWLQNTLSLTTFIPAIKAKGKIFLAPAARITNLTVEEFAVAEDLFFGWFNSKDIEYLYYLAAVLYREPDKDGKRMPFDKTELDARANALRKTDRCTLLAILLSYQGCRAYLTAQFPLVFPKPKGNVKLPKSSGFGKLVLHASGGKFGTHNETKNTNVYTFLGEFEEQLKRKPYA
ncbi:hypothetical protein [Leptobacterium sp. I13]|uniref:hypothetical protein n=1 Tax=Leptobacterium meishanense TaxID=3128904 RepID=UPI0030EC552C